MIGRISNRVYRLVRSTLPEKAINMLPLFEEVNTNLLVGGIERCRISKTWVSEKREWGFYAYCKRSCKAGE